MRRPPSFLALLLPFCLGGCFDMPHPFADPGGQARRLTAANLPPPRLAVPVPAESLLSDEAARLWARDTAQALVAQSVPAVAQAARPGDWWLKLSASVKNGVVVPHYVVMTPDGKARAEDDGPSVDMAGWSAGDATAIGGAAVAEGPRVAGLLTGIQTEMMQADPHSLMHRAAKVYFQGVTGAPGDGNRSLAQAFYAALPDGANAVQTMPKDADFTVRGVVKVKDAGMEDGHPAQHVEIAWHVQAADGKEAGAATQLHDIPAHSLDGAWGDTAAAAGEEAAGGVRTIITNYSGRDRAPAGAKEAKAGAGPAAR